jgi:hypothetical protein
MLAADRDGLERYLRQLWRQAPDERLLVWNKDSRPLDQARVLAAEGELKLQGVSVEVIVEGPRARTLVDHIFHNPHGHAVEAAFEFPLPDGASPSFFTLYPGNKTSRAAGPKTLPDDPDLDGTIPRPPARTPEDALRTIDPACWGEPRVARVVQVTPGASAPQDASPPATGRTGSAAPAAGTFRGRIGSVAAKSHFRILLAYEETLPIRDGRVVYQYPLPTCHLHDLSVSLRVDARLAAKAVVSPADASREAAGSRVTYRRSWRDVTGAGTLSFSALCPDPSVQATTERRQDIYYLLARVRPDVPALPAAPFARHAVFLLDTSAGEHLARFDRCVKLMRSVLEQDPDIERFNVLTFSTGVAWLDPKGWLANTREGREQALTRLDGLQLEGATDLSAALRALAKPPFTIAPKTPLHCFLLSDGKLTAGDTDLPALVARSRALFPWPTRWHCYQTGLGEENAELFSLLTRTGGGVYLCPSDKDVPAAAAAHRRPCLTVRQVRIESAGLARDLFLAGRRVAVYPGGELLLAARLTAPGKAQVVLEGSVGRRAVVQRFPVEVGADGTLAARAWGELAVGSLLGARDARLEPMAVSFARHFSLATRLTSFALVEGEKAREDPTLVTPGVIDLGRLADRHWAELRAPASPYRRRERLREQLDAWVQAEAPRRDLRAIIDLLPEQELIPAEAGLYGGPSRRDSLPPEYVTETRSRRKAPEAYFAEADRRARAGDAGAAARCLCGLLEGYPGDGEVAWQVGCHLVGIRRAAVAARLLTDLAERTPADPKTHRLLAIALEESGRPTLAVLHYEVALAQLGERTGFAGVRDELAHLLRRELGGGKLSPRLRSHFTIRLEELEKLARLEPAALRVSATWNTPAANVELIVTGPGGRAEQAPEPDAGIVGAETGPRRVEFTKDEQGGFTIEVRLDRAAPESAAAELVTVQIVRDAGTTAERVEARRVLLRKQGERAEVARVKP